MGRESVFDWINRTRKCSRTRNIPPYVRIGGGMFTINKDNVDYLIPIGQIRLDKEKQKVLKNLYFSNGKCNKKTNNKLKKIWW